MLVYLAFAVFSSVYYFVFFGLPQLLQEAGGYDPGVVGLLMLPLAGMSVVATPWAVGAMGRFGAAGADCRRRPPDGGGRPDVAAHRHPGDSAGGGPHNPDGHSLRDRRHRPNQGMFVSTRPQERGVAAGIYQTCRYVGAITATVMIGVFAAGGVHQESWAGWSWPCWSCAW